MKSIRFQIEIIDLIVREECWWTFGKITNI